MKNIFLIVLLGLGCSTGYSRDRQMAGDSTAELNAFITKVQQAYARVGLLEFKVKYRYANASAPGKYTDSLTGEVQMDKGRSRFVVDNMETVLTGQYSIQVLKEDKVIYLASAKRTADPNPVSMLDSVFTHIHGTKAIISHTSQTDMLTIDFPPGQQYQRLEMILDARTGFFQRISYSINTAGLVGSEMIDRPGHPAPYQSRGQIDIAFSGYSQGHFSDQLFNPDNFFTRTAGQFQPAGQYKDYHIFLASSNL